MKVQVAQHANYARQVRCREAVDRYMADTTMRMQLRLQQQEASDDPNWATLDPHATSKVHLRQHNGNKCTASVNNKRWDGGIDKSRNTK